MVMAEDYNQWAKANKKRIAREFVRRVGLKTSDEPVGIITAGLPGAGKTEFTLELLKQTEDTPLRIDMDEIAQLIEGYRPQIANKFRGAASEIMNKIYDEVVKQKASFILDGTFASPKAVNNIERAIHKGYKLKVYYIYQQPKLAWEFTQARERIEHRAIDKAGFIDTYYRLHENIIKLSKLKENVTISIILKDSENQIGSIIENVTDISQALPLLLSRTKLEAELQ